MKMLVTSALLGGAITASILGAGSANADTRYEYDGKTPQELVEISLTRSASLPGGQVQGLIAADKEFRKGTVAGDAAAKAILINVVDGPQWAADPALEALAQVLPKKLGGGTNGDKKSAEVGGARHEADGTLLQFRNDVLINKVKKDYDARTERFVDNAAQVRDKLKTAPKPPNTK